MTNKVQKIREEVERLHNEYRNKKGALYFRKALRTVLFIIDSLQEEPKDKCKGCNNVKGCITCVDGSEWAHYKELVLTKEQRERLANIINNDTSTGK